MLRRPNVALYSSSISAMCSRSHVSQMPHFLASHISILPPFPSVISHSVSCHLTSVLNNFQRGACQDLSFYFAVMILSNRMREYHSPFAISESKSNVSHRGKPTKRTLTFSEGSERYQRGSSLIGAQSFRKDV